MNGIKRLYGQYVAAPLARFVLQSTLFQALGFQDTVQDLTFGANVAVEVGSGGIARLTQTSNAAHLFGAPTVGGVAPGAAHAGLRLKIIFRNASGGAAGAATFNAVFKISGGAWTQPGNGQNRTLELFFDGTNWVEYSRTAADVPN